MPFSVDKHQREARRDEELETQTGDQYARKSAWKFACNRPCFKKRVVAVSRFAAQGREKNGGERRGREWRDTLRTRRETKQVACFHKVST